MFSTPIATEMSTHGKYVRAPAELLDMQEDRSIDDSFFSDELFPSGLGAIEVVETIEADPVGTADVVGDEVDTSVDVCATEKPTDETPPTAVSNVDMHERVSNLEKVIAHLARSLESSKRSTDLQETSSDTRQAVEKGWGTTGEQNAETSSDNRQAVEKSWGITGEQNVMDRASSGSASSFRWDQIPPFPRDVPANKLWEEWQRFLENFEIAVSLSCAFDPVSRAKLLFLSMGPDLQGIVRAAKLRPNLDNSMCYTRFVNNVDAHLKSMTDTSSEHEAFTGMQQRKGESVVSFHSRLTEKVRLCGYSPEDQERFVRTQLLKGMQNKGLAKTARTFGYETNYIVQCATRDEAFEEDNKQNDNRDQTAYAVTNRGDDDDKRFKKYTPRSRDRLESKVIDQKSGRHGHGRRSRCSRCNRLSHSGNRCPAINKKCNSCGTVGHFAMACRKRRVNQVQDNHNVKRKRNDSSDYNEDDIDKQVR